MPLGGVGANLGGGFGLGLVSLIACYRRAGSLQWARQGRLHARTTATAGARAWGPKPPLTVCSHTPDQRSSPIMFYILIINSYLSPFWVKLSASRRLVLKSTALLFCNFRVFHPFIQPINRTRALVCGVLTPVDSQLFVSLETPLLISRPRRRIGRGTYSAY